MSTILWFIVGLLTGILFAYHLPSSDNVTATLRQIQRQYLRGSHEKKSRLEKTTISSPISTAPPLLQLTTTSSSPPPPPQGSQPNSLQQPTQKKSNRTSTKPPDHHQHAQSSRLLKVTEFDPLSATTLLQNGRASKRTKAGRRSIRGAKNSLRAGSSKRTLPPLTKSDSTPVAAIDTLSSATQQPVATGPESIPLDAESRWRDHHKKRQWAQTLLMESMEPVLSKHLRHSIKSVLHFTSVGPETMDLKTTGQGIGHWNSFLNQIAPPSRKPSANLLSTRESLDISRISIVHPTIPDKTEPQIPHIVPAVAEPPQLQPPLPIEPIGRRDTTVAIKFRNNRDREDRTTLGTTPLIIRGFGSPERPLPPTPILITKAPDNPTIEHISSIKAEEIIPRPRRATLMNPPTQSVTALQMSTSQETIGKGSNIRMASLSSSTTRHDQDNQLVDSSPAEDNIPPPAASRQSRLWSKVRRVVTGESRQSGQTRNSIYQTVGTGGPSRTLSDTQLPSRPTSTSSSSSYNIAMPSFSSSVLSLFSEDQMSSQQGPSGSQHNQTPSIPFQTPPETAPNSPTSSRYPHALPGLARRSSTKSPAVAAAVTTAESKVNQFMYPGQHIRQTSSVASIPEGASGEDFVFQDFDLPRDPDSTVRWAPSRRSEDKALSPTRSMSIPSSLARSKSVTDPPSKFSKAEPSDHRLPRGPHDAPLHELNQFSAPHRHAHDHGMISPPKDLENLSASKRVSIEFGQEQQASAPSPIRNEVTWRSSMADPPLDETESSLALILGQNDHTSKQDRRKSAISFGGYFSNPSDAAKRARDQIERTGIGLEKDANGEIIQLRRTTFFEKPAPPSLPSFVSWMQPGSSNLTITDPALQHHLRSSTVSVTGPEPAPRPDSFRAAKASELANGSTVLPKSGGASEARKRITPLRITPLLSGITSIPSPMFAPLSAAVPRPLTLSGSLDRYFYTVDQVHEWNIPTYGRVKFTDHAPQVFHAIREQLNYTLADMDEALSSPMTVMRTQGKSDAIFFASHNHGRFLLKTLRGAEPENLKGFLVDYLAHIQKNPNTLLPRYLGMYTFERLAGAKLHTGNGSGVTNLGDGGDRSSASGLGCGRSDNSTAQRLHLNGTLLSAKDDNLPSKLVVVVLANVFDTPEVINERYDFKGSNVGRRTLPEKSVGRERELARGNRNSSDFDSAGASADFPRFSFLRSDSGPRGTQFSPNSTGGEESTVSEDISHMTLKEVDFQNRVYNGETKLIHVGAARKAELLAQLEEDLALLRKHTFMDYSMLVGIRKVRKVKAPQYESRASSVISSRRGSRSSRGSDADNSNLESDEDVVSVIESVRSNPESTQALPTPETMGRYKAIVNFSDHFNKEAAAFMKELGAKAQEAIQEIYSFGEDLLSRTKLTETDTKNTQQRVRIVELTTLQTNAENVPDGPDATTRGKSRFSKRAKARAEAMIDPDAFQTVRYKPRNPQAQGNTGHPSIALAVEESKNVHTIRGKDVLRSAPKASTPSQNISPGTSTTPFNAVDGGSEISWSQGIASVGLEDDDEEFEMVYYFGLIDILQKYNLVKWFERNLKGANVRIMGSGSALSSHGAGSNPAPITPVPLVHPGRSNVSSSFSAASFYQFLPMASSSEPSLPSALEASSAPVSSPMPSLPTHHTLSVLLEDADYSASGSSRIFGLEDSSSTSGGLRTRSSVDLESSTATSPSPTHPVARTSSYSATGVSAATTLAAIQKSNISSRLSQFSQYSHSSQQSQQSHQSSRSRDSRLSFDMRDSSLSADAGSSSTDNHHQEPFSASPPSMQSLQSLQQQHQQQARQSLPMSMSQTAEVSVEEPVRYSERLIEFMRGVMV
ncbi:Phosphatidylinositol 5-phosphate 4-kinase type-2 alpha [Gryganskiella cystojenkinii]|nr:Phosphatidylinositol 5-phosphate 4-kinase type-2 alpha [Gryganskiella cystojenkinii]